MSSKTVVLWPWKHISMAAQMALFWKFFKLICMLSGRDVCLGCWPDFLQDFFVHLTRRRKSVKSDVDFFSEVMTDCVYSTMLLLSHFALLFLFGKPPTLNLSAVPNVNWLHWLHERVVFCNSSILHTKFQNFFHESPLHNNLQQLFWSAGLIEFVWGSLSKDFSIGNLPQNYYLITTRKLSVLVTYHGAQKFHSLNRKRRFNEIYVKRSAFKSTFRIWLQNCRNIFVTAVTCKKLHNSQ